jgi:hypothetical protein
LRIIINQSNLELAYSTKDYSKKVATSGPRKSGACRAINSVVKFVILQFYSLQASFSLLVTGFNLCRSIIVVTFVQPSMLFNAIISMTPGWLPILNPIVTIFTIRPFRCAMLHIFRKKTATTTSPNEVILF